MRLRSLARRFLAAQEGSESVGSAGWSLYQYLDKDGRFDYDRYRAAQVDASKRKIHSVWVKEENIQFLSNYIRTVIPKPSLGLCHGTRRGLEQKWFRKYLNCEVIGTEISDTAGNFPDTIQWDFHDVKPEWVGTADFVYSNSFDHSYDPQRCLNAWVSCLRPDGVLIIEHSTDHVVARETDPFGAQLAVMPYLVLSWSRGAYSVREILDAPSAATIGGNAYESVFLIVKRS